MMLCEEKQTPSAISFEVKLSDPNPAKVPEIAKKLE